MNHPVCSYPVHTSFFCFLMKTTDTSRFLTAVFLEVSWGKPSHSSSGQRDLLFDSVTVLLLSYYYFARHGLGSCLSRLHNRILNGIFTGIPYVPLPCVLIQALAVCHSPFCHIDFSMSSAVIDFNNYCIDI